MSFDLVLFGAEGPTTAAGVAAMMDAGEIGPEMPLTPELAAVVDGLEARWPTAGGGEDHPWAVLPLPTTMSDGMIGLCIVTSRIEEACEEVYDLAEEHGVSVYDPQNDDLTLPPV